MVVEVVTPGPEEVGTTLQPAHPTHITALPDIDLQALAASIPPPPEVNNLQIILQQHQAVYNTLAPTQAELAAFQHDQDARFSWMQQRLNCILAEGNANFRQMYDSLVQDLKVVVGHQKGLHV